jgi:hypothetical protein
METSSKDQDKMGTTLKERDVQISFQFFLILITKKCRRFHELLQLLNYTVFKETQKTNLIFCAESR